MNASEIQAIDVHGHYGNTIDRGVDEFVSADAATVARRAKLANIKTTIVSPFSGLFPRGHANAFKGNVEAARVVAQTDGLLQWVIVHPRQIETYSQAAEMLQLPQCVGIKIHPEEHVYPISEYGDAIFEFAARHDAVVLAHSGDELSRAGDFIPFANEYPNATLILAHLGNGGGARGEHDQQVRAIQQSRGGNVYVDTSSARSILPGLVEWAVQEVGAERILFGTDTPLYFTAMQRIRIDRAEISLAEKRMILVENAERILAASGLQFERHYADA